MIGAMSVCALGQSGGGFEGWDEMVDSRFRFDPDRHVILTYQVPAKAEVRLLFSRVDELLKEDNTASALRFLQQIIDSFGHSVIQVATDRYVGAAEFARYRLLNLTSDARLSYDETAELRGRERLRRAQADRDMDSLREVARRYANAAVGQEALLWMARMELEAGNRQIASMMARRCLDFLPVSHAQETPASERRHLALALITLAEGELPASQEPEANASIPVAGESTKLDRLASIAGAEPERLAEDWWPTYGGQAARRRSMQAPAMPLDFEEHVRLLVPSHELQNDDNPLPYWWDVLPPVQPARAGELLVLNNTATVKAYNLYADRVEWEFRGPMAYDLADSFPLSEYTDAYLRGNRGVNPISRGLIAGVSVNRGVVVANLQVPEAARSVYSIGQKITINRPYAWRGLFALSLEDGELLWSQRGRARYDELRGVMTWHEESAPGDEEGVVARLDVPGPPAILDDTVFALGHFIEGAVNSYLVAIDLHSGAIRDTVPLVIGQQELSMFNMPFQEFTTGIPVVGEGTVYCPTNLGLLAAVDATFGDLRWLSAYDSIPIQPPPNYYNNNPRNVYWYNNPPMVADGVVIVSPHDSEYVHALDAATGKLRWQYNAAAPVPKDSGPNNFLLGVQRSHVVLVSGGFVRALDVQTGKHVWNQPFGLNDFDPVGRGCVTDDRVYIPTRPMVVVLDEHGRDKDIINWPDLVNVEDSRRRYHRVDAESGNIAGNFFVFPDMLVSVNRDWAGVAFDAGRVLSDLLAAAPGESVAFTDLTRIASLYRRQGELVNAAATFEKALELSQTMPVSATELGRVRFNLCRTLLESSEWYADRTDVESARRALLKAEPYADELPSRLEVTRLYLESLGANGLDDRAVSWLNKLRDGHGHERARFDRVSSREIAIGLYASIELARRAGSQGNTKSALEEWQRVHLEYAGEYLDDSTAGEMARQQIGKLLASAGGDLRLQYDEDARRELETAYEQENLERLGLLLRKYPGASAAPTYTAHYCQLLRKEGRWPEALAAGAELLRRDPEPSTSQRVLEEMVVSAANLGNHELVSQLLTKLSTDPEEGLRREIEQVRPAHVPLAPPDQPPTLETAFSLPPGAAVVRIEREENGVAEPALFAVDSTQRTLMRLSLESPDQPVWETPMPESNRFLRQFYEAAGSLILWQQEELYAFDGNDGLPRWRRRFEEEVLSIATRAGVLLIVAQRNESPGSHEEGTLELIAVEPRSGNDLWRQPMVGPQFLSPVRGQGGLAAVVSRRHSQSLPEVEVFDVTTGMRRFGPHPMMSIPRNLPPVNEELDLVVVGQRDEVTSRRTTKIATQLAAYRFGASEPTWFLDLERDFEAQLEDVFPWGDDALCVKVRNPQGTQRSFLLVDFATGKLKREVEVPWSISNFRQIRDPQTGERLLVGWGRVTQELPMVAYDEQLESYWGMKKHQLSDTPLTIQSWRFAKRGQHLVLFKGDTGNSASKDLLCFDLESGELLHQEPIAVRGRDRSQVSLIGDRIVWSVGESVHVFRWN